MQEEDLEKKIKMIQQMDEKTEKKNSKSKLSKEINEDVLVLEADTNQNYTFDLKLFLHVLEKLNEEYKNPPLVVSHSDKYFYGLYNIKGISPNKIIVHITSGVGKFITISTPTMYKNLHLNSGAIQKILDTFSKTYKKYDKFKFEAPYQAKYMYVWYSYKENAICINVTNETYQKLLKQNYFE